MARASVAKRRGALRRGHVAEFAALAFLMLKGYRPIARRFSASGGEIDLIVRRGRNVVFVEVKARGMLADARIAIGAAKRRRFSRAVRAWASRNPWCESWTLRADAVFLAPMRLPVHLEHAFVIEGF
jgi:putative endonuclease